MNTTAKNRKTLIGGLVGLVLIGGGAAVGLSAANAGTTPPAPVTQPAPDNESNDERQDPKLGGSITVPETAGEQSDAQESGQLAALAKIDAKTAEAAALTSVPGSSIVSSGLGDENGSLVYEVTVKDGAGTLSEVKVDAGNATVLATEAAESADGQNGENGETTEASDATETPDAGVNTAR
jgi:uncharacterized membrane protein YkoI